MVKAKGMTSVVNTKPSGEELLTDDLRRELEDQPEIKNIIVEKRKRAKESDQQG